MIINAISNTIPFLLILGSYGYISFYYFKAIRFLKKSNLKKDLEFRTTCTIFLLVFVYALILSSYFFADISQQDNPLVYQIFRYLYLLPYSTDCFIYTLSTQFRKAYVHTFKEWKAYLLNMFNSDDGEMFIFEFD